MQKNFINLLAQQATLWALGVITDYHFGLPVWAWYVIAATSIIVTIKTAPRTEMKMGDVDAKTLVELEKIRTEHKKLLFEWLHYSLDFFAAIIIFGLLLLPFILMIVL